MTTPDQDIQNPQLTAQTETETDFSVNTPQVVVGDFTTKGARPDQADDFRRAEQRWVTIDCMAPSPEKAEA